MKEEVRITVSRKKAANLIQNQVENGEKILSYPISDEHSYKLAQESESYWIDYTNELLRKLFTSDRLQQEFQNSVRSWGIGMPFDAQVQQFHELLNVRITCLRSIFNRLEFFDEKADTLYDTKSNIQNSTGVSTMTDIWESIQKDYDINKIQFGRKINFVTDQFKRKIIFRDVEHAYELSKNNYSKPAVILAGGVLEELLRLYLDYKEIKSESDNFNGYIKACVQNGFIKDGINGLTDSVRHFRNHVHLSKEKTSRNTISKATAVGAVSSIFTIINDLNH